MFEASRLLTRDGRLLFATRTARLFSYGFLSVVLALYLARLGLSEPRIGVLLTATLLGDTAVSFWIVTNADRLGRRRMLSVGAVLMIFAGSVFAATSDFFVLLVAAIVGVISPSGNEVGPFLPIEQAALSQIVSAEARTKVFAWYNLSGSFATALGSLAGGALVQALQNAGWPDVMSYRAVVSGYAVMGLPLLLLFARLSPATELPTSSPESLSREMPWIGVRESRGLVLRLAGLFSLDAFAGGFVLQSLVAYWFSIRFGVTPGLLGGIFFGANILAGISALGAARLAARIGLINTMVFTHIPSNILLLLVPLMPNAPLAIAVLLLRFSISQMDVPTRQSYTMAVVSPEERSAAAGITGIARTIGASLAPVIAGPLLADAALLGVPFFISGGLKIAYDLLLYRSFRKHRPPEEAADSHSTGVS